MSDDDNLFSRWSRRKQAVVKETALETQSQAKPDANEPAIVEPETEEEEKALLEQLGLPVPETLTEGDDFSVFMQDGVPEFLRKRALRKLWRSNPVLANLDGLNDYDDDFNAPELTQKVLATAYEVGKGIFRKAVEDSVDNSEEPDTPEPELLEVPQQDIDFETISLPVDPSGSDASEDDIPRPRRMRFVTHA